MFVTTPDLEDLVASLQEARRSCQIPGGMVATSEAVVDCLMALLFPQHVRDWSVHQELYALDRYLGELLDVDDQRDATGLVLQTLPTLRELLVGDAEALLAGDPAARSVDEVVLAYPGFHATVLHRFAHEIHAYAPTAARLIAACGQRRTGVDIHPGAQVGERFSIDHATGVVIGETAVIGSGVRLYQGVTLGAVRVRRSEQGVKRHPTLEDDVTVYANATILGGSTVVGRGSVIGGNVWLTRSVDPGSVVTTQEGPEVLLDFYL